MRMMNNSCKLLFAVLLFLFATFKLFFFRHSFAPFFFYPIRVKIKNFTLHADYVTQKLK